MRRLWSAVIIILIASVAFSADSKGQNDPNCPNDPNYPNDPSELIRTKWNAVISVLHSEDLDQEARIEKLNTIVSPIFDFPLMAKLALGREHWSELTDDQQEKFTRLFVERLRFSYREKVSLYTNEEVEFKPAVKKNSMVYIPIEFKAKDKKIAIMHKLRKVDNRWKVYDVEIQGISILLTYRSQFDDILSKGTVDDLLARLAEPPEQ